MGKEKVGEKRMERGKINEEKVKGRCGNDDSSILPQTTSSLLF